MTISEFRGMREAVAVVCIAAVLSVGFPARATIDVSGSDPVSRWVHSLPATCSFFRPQESYWVGAVMNDDWKQFPKTSDGTAILGGVAEIRAFYDPVHKIAGFVESGTDTLNYGAIAGAPAPPPHVAVTKDLSSVTFGGNIRLGDTLAQVSTAVGLHSMLHPSAAPQCPGYSAVGFCSWNRTSCECPGGSPSGPEKKFGVVVFRQGRVVALIWDDGACGMS